jgi:hypothetical protein
MDLPAGQVSIPEGVVRRAFGDDKVLLNLATGHYHALNQTGERMVDLLEETGSASDTAAKVSEEFGQPLERVSEDLAQLCEELESRGLIAIVRD